MPRIAYVNGRYVAHADAAVHVEDRGFQFADSVYEVMAVMQGRIVDEKGHLDRLDRSLAELRISPLLQRKPLMLAMRELLRRNRLQDAYIYLQVTRGAAPRDFKFPEKSVASLVMTVRPASFDLDLRKRTARKVVTVPDIRWKRKDIKSTALLAQVLAKQQAVDKGGYEAWMVDDQGFITEGASSNAWIVTAKGELVTRPTAQNAILKGVTRSALQQLCKKRGIRIVERAFTVKEAYAAKEAFTSSAVALLVPVSEIDGKKIGGGAIGPVTAQLLDLYMHYANNDRQFSWDAR